MIPNAVPVREAARRKGIGTTGIYAAIRRGALKVADVEGYTLVLLDDAFEAYTPDPRKVGQRGGRRLDASAQ